MPLAVVDGLCVRADRLSLSIFLRDVERVLQRLVDVESLRAAGSRLVEKRWNDEQENKQAHGAT